MFGVQLVRVGWKNCLQNRDGERKGRDVREGGGGVLNMSLEV